MKLLFVHDHRLRVVDEKTYTTGALGTLPQYMEVFDQVTLVARVQESSDVTGLCVMHQEGLSVSGFPSLRSAFSWQGYLQLRREVQECDAVVARLPSMLGLLALAIARQQSRASMIELVGCPRDALRFHSLRGALVSPVAGLMTRRALQRATHGIYVTQSFLQSRYPSKARQVSISDVELPSFGCLRIHRNRNSLPIVLGTAADVGQRYKGQGYAIKAVAELVAAGEDVRYELAGGGDSRRLQRLVRKLGLGDRVRFLGRLGREELHAWYDSLSIYLQPSVTEGLPRALIEAMSHGLPCVASNVGGMSELLEPRWLVAPKQVPGLRVAIQDMLQTDWRFEGGRNRQVSEQYASNILRARRLGFLREFRRYAE